MTKQAQWAEYGLRFGFVARTSREAMTQRPTYYLRQRTADGWRYAECNYFAGLAPESHDDFLRQLRGWCDGSLANDRLTSSAVRCGVDMLEQPLPDTPWTRGQHGIDINGLIWIDSRERMLQAIDSKLEQGFRVLKLKIGSLTFDQEVEIIRMLRQRYSAADLELRLDANGSFAPDRALERLQRLAPLGIHSIEQPLMAGQIEATARLCAQSPVPIALDEELIGCRTPEQMQQLLADIRPQYVILKPSLCGGFRAADQWIAVAEAQGIGWWATSALESSLGLLRIAAWVSARDIVMPQGLGTGQIYTNNLPSTLELRGPELWTATPPAIDLRALERLDWN